MVLVIAALVATVEDVWIVMVCTDLLDDAEEEVLLA